METIAYRNALQGTTSRFHFHHVLVGLLMCLALAVSLFFFSGESLRLDESQSLWQSSHSVSRILDIVGQDVHVPLYHLILHFWQLMVGGGVAGARFLSLLFFLAGIPLMYALGMRAFEHRAAALFATALFALSPFMNWYGNEIRMYSMLTFLALLSHFLFLGIYREGGGFGRWAGYAAVSIVGVFTHYFFWLVIAAQFVFYLAVRRAFPAGSGKNLAGVFGLLALAFLPWLLYLRNLNQLAASSQPLLPVPTSIDVWNAFSQFIIGFQNDWLNALVVSLWPLVVLVSFLTLRRHSTVPREAGYFLAMLLLPALALFTASVLLKPIYVSRYLIFTAPALYLLVGWVLTLYPRFVSFFGKAGLIAAMAAGLYLQVTNADMQMRENYRAAAEYMSAGTAPSDIVILSAPFTVYPVEYYYKGPADIRTLPEWDRSLRGDIPPFNEDSLPEDVARLTEGHRRAWLLLSYDQGYEDEIRNYFDTRYHMLDRKRFSEGLDLYVYQLRYGEAWAEHELTALRR
ncbi:MAG: glycosyltransferase family 39 protein [bacterium]|nr:glycosyltransferase family 39 protein [bacterium]